MLFFSGNLMMLLVDVVYLSSVVYLRLKGGFSAMLSSVCILRAA